MKQTMTVTERVRAEHAKALHKPRPCEAAVHLMDNPEYARARLNAVLASANAYRVTGRVPPSRKRMPAIRQLALL